jgi:tRNA-splicing ligase RtcB (3'-phosphate/5'-hydroxy nucleic acid ligase)
MAYEMLPGTRAPVRMWADPASVEPDALAQLRNVASLPWTRQVAVMPDVHYGKGATVGSVIAMEQAISPAAVGVDIGCGMSAVRSSITASQLPDNLSGVRAAIEDMVPVGWSAHDRPVRPPHGTGGWPQFWETFRHLHEGV